jgi:predicted membrane channel-forming protein YqfA (hemolysin III family)
MSRRDVDGIGTVVLIVAGVTALATVLGQSNLGVPLLALAYWLAVILVIRPYVYERFSTATADWVVVFLVLGPATLFVAPVLWWQHRGWAATSE